MHSINVSLFISLAITLCYSENLPLVKTKLGKIKGHYRTSPRNITFEAYEGVPYAVPPIKENRFYVSNYRKYKKITLKSAPLSLFRCTKIYNS